MFGTGKKAAGGSPAGKHGGGLSFIGADVTVNGDVASGGQIHVDGRVNGDVACDTLVQGGGGTIAGRIICETVHLAGLVDGTVQGRVVTLEPSARVTGDVSYETLSIAAGATIEGRLTRREAGIALATPAADGKAKPAAKAQKADGDAKPDEPGLLAMSGAAAVGAPN